MKTILSIIFCVLTISLSSQIIVNNPYVRDKEFEIYKNSDKHTQIVTQNYLDNFELDTTKKHNYKINLIYSLKQSYDIKNKYYASDFKVGANIKYDFSQKIRFNALYFIGLNKPEEFFLPTTDKMKIIPGFGRTITNKGNWYLYDNFIGNLQYTPFNYLKIELGKDKTFLGDGYRSLLMSDNSCPSWFFRTTVEVWRIKYLFMVSSQKDFDSRFPDQHFTNKHNFTHYLSLNIGKRLNLSLFETVIASPYDSIGGGRGLELNYLNPVIFMRPVEFSIGSPDNVLVGISGHLKIFKTGMLYGQIFIDEFIRSHITSSKEYWDEKYGLQAGFKFYNLFGVNNLYVQGELNAVRPYTYSHGNPIEAYCNMYQPIAHPLGSNFVEGLALMSYKINDFVIQAKVVYTKYGENDSLNYGRDPRISYISRVGDEDIKWLQGTKTNFKCVDLMFAYYSKYNSQISLNIIYRDTNTINKKSISFMLRFATPLFSEYYDYN